MRTERKIIVKTGEDKERYIMAKNGYRASMDLPKDLKYLYRGMVLKDIVITENTHTIQVYIGLKGGTKKTEDKEKETEEYRKQKKK